MYSVVPGVEPEWIVNRTAECHLGSDVGSSTVIGGNHRKDQLGADFNKQKILP